MTDFNKVLSKPLTRALYAREERHLVDHGTPNPYPHGGRGHASQILRAQLRRGFGAKRRAAR